MSPETPVDGPRDRGVWGDAPGPDALDDAGFEGPEINVREYLRLLWNGRWVVVGVTAAVVVVALAWALTRPELYRAVTTISIDSRPPQIIKNQINLSPSWWELERYVQEQERVLRSHTLATRVVERLGLANNPELPADAVAEKLRGMIAVEPMEAGEAGSNVLDVTMEGTDPERIAEWLNVYIEEYIAFNIEDNIQRMQQIYDVIQDKLQPLREELGESEERLTDFKEREGSLLVADEGKNVILEQIDTLTTDYARTKAERIRLETQIAALERIQREGASLAVFPEVMDDAGVQGLRDQLANLEVELEEKLKTYKRGHPVIRDLEGRIEGIRQQIAKRVDGIIGSLRTEYQIKLQRETSLYENLQELKKDSIRLSKQVMELEKLEREYEQNKLFYEEMWARSKEADISGTVATNNIRIIDRARPPRAPFSPNLPRTLMLAVVLGGFMGVGLVLGLDFLDRSLRTPEDVERATGTAVLSVVPRFDGSPTGVAREAFQALRTALLFAAPDEQSQVVMVTSAGPGEGKTTTVFELARTMSAAGDSVLAVDADLRKPRLHRLAGCPNGDGLSTAVLGEVAFEDAVKECSGATGLQVMPAGPTPPNPPELFSKKTFVDLLAEAKKRYRWVLIDTPPIASVTDPVMCSSLADMVLMVTQYGSIDRRVVVGGVRQLLRVGARVVGTVFNNVDMKKSHYYGGVYYAGYYPDSESTSVANDAESPRGSS